jgi:predicted metal-binding membrane protein
MRCGVSCMGCCWALMTPLFVAGMMSAIALVAIAAFIATEKMLPRGAAAKFAGIALVAGGVVIPIGR